MKPVLQVFQVDQCKYCFDHNSLDIERIITKFGQMNLLVKNFRMQAWLLRKIVTIATNVEVNNYVIFCAIEAKIGRLFLYSKKNFRKFGCYGELPWQR